MIEEERARIISFAVPEHATGDVIGKGGETIRNIQDTTGCRVNLDRDSGRCQITGPDRDCMEKAKVSARLLVSLCDCPRRREYTRRPPSLFFVLFDMVRTGND